MNIAILTADPSNYSNRRMIEAGRELGHNIYPLLTLHQRLDVDAQAFLERLNPRPDAVIPRIGVPLSGLGRCLITAFEGADIFTMTSSCGLAHSRDKFLAGQVLHKAGLAMPKTLTFSHPGQIDEAIRAIGGYPFIVKRLKGTGGKAVRLINDVDKAHKRLGKYISKRKPFLIQEFIKEAKGSDLRVFVVGGRVIAAMRRVAADDDFRANIHAGGHGENVKLSPEEEACALTAAKVLDLSIAGVDILRSARGPLILEVNSSPGLQGIESTTKIDIAAEIINYIAAQVKARANG